MHAKEVLKRDESESIRCRYPVYIDDICSHIGAREDIRVSKVFYGLVLLGYGIKYRDFKNGDTLMQDVVKAICTMRSSDNESNLAVSSSVGNAFSFEGTTHKFRYKHNFIAEVSDYANKSNNKSPDVYMYYALVGLREIGSSEEYEHLKTFSRYIKAMYDLERAELNFKAATNFIRGFYSEK